MTTPSPIIRSAHVPRPREETFELFTAEIGSWWPLPTHGIFEAEAGGVFFDDGRLVERSTDGRESVWAEIVSWVDGERIVLNWFPGRSADDASEVEFRFDDDDAGTRVTIEHRGWERFGPDAFARRRGYLGPNAWGSILDNFGDAAEPKVPAETLSRLINGYDAFFAEAEKGGFGPAPDGEFGAAEVIAHIGLNDAAMASVCQALIHGTEPRFDNHRCHDADALARWIDEAGSNEASDLSGLIAKGRAIARQVVGLVSRLNEQQLAADVHCEMEHDGAIVLDDARPWSAIVIDAQTGHHLPGHIGQLQDLRP